MEHFHIRKGVAEDSYRLAEIAKTTLQDPWTVAQFTEEFANPLSQIFVAVDKNSIPPGFLVLHLGDNAVIQLVAVDKDHQRRGLGEALVTQSVRIAKKAGCQQLTLDVRESNKKALSFYRALGFQLLHTAKHRYHHPREDALILGLFL